MDLSEYRIMRSLEDHYWWYQGLRRLVAQNARQLLADRPSPRILDAGCGTGGTMVALRQALPQAEIMGIDLNEDAVQISGQRQVGPVSLGSVESIPYPAQHFDLLVSLDVLYFKNLDNEKALGEFYRVLKKGGRLILNLPAFESLRGSHDLAVSTGRRYTKGQVKNMLKAAGFKPLRLYYWNTLLFPFLLIWRPLSVLWADKASPRSDLKPLSPVLNKILSSFIHFEMALDRRVPIPFGSSLFAVAEK